MYNIKRTFILCMVISIAQFFTCASSVLSPLFTLTQKFTQICAVNIHKNPIFSVIVTATFAKMLYVHWKNSHVKTPIKKEQIREEINEKLGREKTTLVKIFFKTIFRKILWRMLPGPKNINLKDIFHESSQKNQRTLLAKMAIALRSNQSTLLEVLVEKKPDQFISPGTRLPLVNGKSVTQQI